MTTKHTHPMIFGRRETGCPRCDELVAGAPVVKWAGTLRREDEARQVAAIRAHRCDVSGCGPVCTAFDW
jgi:hypothetical protein